MAEKLLEQLGAVPALLFSADRASFDGESEGEDFPPAEQLGFDGYVLDRLGSIQWPTFWREVQDQFCGDFSPRDQFCSDCKGGNGCAFKFENDVAPRVPFKAMDRKSSQCCDPFQRDGAVPRPPSGRRLCVCVGHGGNGNVGWRRKEGENSLPEAGGRGDRLGAPQRPVDQLGLRNEQREREFHLRRLQKKRRAHGEEIEK
jgi:hypothetical protein